MKGPSRATGGLGCVARSAQLERDREVNGRGGLEPVRYDDWEVKGIASDF